MLVQGWERGSYAALAALSRVRSSARRFPISGQDRMTSATIATLRDYASVPLIDRLRWLDELVRFTLLWREAPRVAAADSTANSSLPSQ
jgi:hypothetical protein